jgi:signal peptidase II
LDRARAGGLTAGRALCAIVAIAVFIVDRVTKILVAANIPVGTERQVLPFLWIADAQNSGAAFGIGRSATLIFTAASIVIGAAIVVYVVRNPIDPAFGAVLGIILGGTVGNGWDRLVHGEVTDFIDLHWWPVFNVADSAVTVGVALLVVGYLLRHRHDS